MDGVCGGKCDLRAAPAAVAASSQWNSGFEQDLIALTHEDSSWVQGLHWLGELRTDILNPTAPVQRPTGGRGLRCRVQGQAGFGGEGAHLCMPVARAIPPFWGCAYSLARHD